MMGVTHIDVPTTALSDRVAKALQNIQDSPTWHPLLGRLIEVTQGPLKGYHGLVKSVNEPNSSAQVEFEALLSRRTIKLPLGNLQVAPERRNERQYGRDCYEPVPEPVPERERTPMPDILSSSCLWSLNDAFSVGPIQPPAQTYVNVSMEGIYYSVY